MLRTRRRPVPHDKNLSFRDSKLSRDVRTMLIAPEMSSAIPPTMTSFELPREARPAVSAKGTVKPSLFDASTDEQNAM